MLSLKIPAIIRLKRLSSKAYEFSATPQMNNQPAETVNKLHIFYFLLPSFHTCSGNKQLERAVLFGVVSNHYLSLSWCNVDFLNLKKKKKN